MPNWSDHLIPVPIVLPFAASALMLLFDERSRTLKRAMAVATTVALLATSISLLAAAADATAARIYLVGDWPAPFGITLLVDRLSAMMLVLTSVLGFTSLVYASAR
jgi:multicomponent K+:H+ antiporter subunit D